MLSLLKLDFQESNKIEYAIDIRGDWFTYINNLEKDKKYANWPKSLHDLLQPTFPGMLRHIAKNMFHMVFVINPSSAEGKDLLKILEAFYVHNAPVR